MAQTGCVYVNNIWFMVFECVYGVVFSWSLMRQAE